MCRARGSVIFPGVLLAVLGVACDIRNNSPVEVTGQLEAVTVAAGSRVGGRIAEVLVREGQQVRAGAPLIKLESAEAESAVAAAQARLDQARATLAKLEAGARPDELRQAEAAAKRAEEQLRIAQTGSRLQEKQAAKATADAARAQRDEARAEFERVERLFEGDAASQQRYDQARHALDAAEAQFQAAFERQRLVEEGARTEEVAIAKAAYDQALAGLALVREGPRAEDIEAARAQCELAEADLRRARVTLDEMAICSPMDGVVESLDVHPGDLVKPGPAVTIVNPEDLEAVVYVSAALLGHLRTGQKVSFTTDSHGNEVFEAAIVRIAAQGEFTPRNLQTREERVQQVFGVKLKMDSAGGRLRAGMTITARITPAEGAAE